MQYIYNYRNKKTLEIKKLVEKTPDKWGELLLTGGFFDPIDP